MAQSGGSINSLFKKYYGRDATADERSYWAGKDAPQLRDALMKTDTGGKRQQINNLFQRYYGRDATKEESDNYAKGKDLDILEQKLAESPRAETYTGEKEATKAKEDYEAEQAKRKEYYEKEFEPAWQKEYEESEAEYKRSVEAWQDNRNKLNDQYKDAVERGDTDKAQYIKRLYDDYKQNVSRMADDRQVYITDLEKKTGQNLGAADVSYAERGLFRSGSREQKKGYIQEEAEGTKGKYETAYGRQTEDVTQQKERGEKDYMTAYERQKADMASDYGYATKASERSKAGGEAGWEAYQRDWEKRKQAHEAGYYDTGKYEGLIGTGYQGWKPPSNPVYGAISKSESAQRKKA